MNLLYPKLSLQTWKQFATMILTGCIVAGCYGMLHDEITYTLAPEYFTKLKFDQFHLTKLSWPPRLAVAVVGFLASWWVGLIGGWILTRIILSRASAHEAWRYYLHALAILLGITLLAGIIGLSLATFSSGNDAQWIEACNGLGVPNASAFRQVAFIHLGSYVGAGIGLIVAVVRIWKQHEVTE